MKNSMTDQQKLYDSIALLQEKNELPGLNGLLDLYKETKDYEIKNNVSILLFYHFFWKDQYDQIDRLNILEFFNMNPTFMDLVHLGQKHPKVISYVKESQSLPVTYNELSTPLIDLKIGDKAHRFWLDPSVSLSSISMDFIEKNNLEASVEIMTHEGIYDQAYLVISAMELGNLKLENHTFLVLPTEYSQVELEGHPQPIKIEGVIGMDLIKYFDFTLDFTTDTYVLSKPTKNEEKNKNILFDNFVLAKVDYKEKEVIVGLDPLVDQTYMSEDFFEENEMAYKTGNIQAEGSTGYEVIQADYVEALTLGVNGQAFELENVWNVGQMMTDIYQVDGVLGGDVLRKSKLHFDLFNGHFSVS